jgi:glycosyltransferase involved in cell wall biosynthesis
MFAASFPSPSALEFADRPMRGETVIVVPCYNEAARLDLGAFASFLKRSEGVSLLMVDDGSTDGTPHVLEQLRSWHPRQVAVLGLGANVGKAEAVRRGAKIALRRAPSMVGYWDADLATPLDAIVNFRSVLAERPELVLVMGSRVALLGRQIRRSWKRHLLGRAFATAASLVLGLTVYDTQCGAKLFRVTPETAALFDRPFRARWIFDVEILARMIATSRLDGERMADELIYEYPLERWQDVQGSRLKSHDFLVAATDLAAIRWQYLRERAPRRVARTQPVTEPARREAA